MKRILIAALVVVCAHTAWADEPREIPMTGSPAADAAFTLVNAMNRQMRMIEEDANAYTKAVEYYKQLQDMEQKVLAERKKLAELEKQLSQQERDLKANFERERAGKSDADRDKLEEIYQQRKKELSDARKQVNGVPALLKTLGGHIGNQAKVLKSVKTKEDWVDPATGLGRARRQFQMQRSKITTLTDKLAGITQNVKEVIEKGSALDFKGERTGAFEGKVVSVATPTPAWEWTVNGVTPAKGNTFAIGDDRTIKIQVKLVEDRRKQSRTIKGSSVTTVTVNKKDYDFEYGNNNSSSHWTIKEEEYSDWRVEARTPRDPGKKVSSSGVFATVKGDVMTVEFSPDTASETLRISVIGRVEWQMEGTRNGSPVLDGADASGNWWIEIGINPRK